MIFLIYFFWGEKPSDGGGHAPPPPGFTPMVLAYLRRLMSVCFRNWRHDVLRVHARGVKSWQGVRFRDNTCYTLGVFKDLERLYMTTARRVLKPSVLRMSSSGNLTSHSLTYSSPLWMRTWVTLLHLWTN